jgi:hypothetical protein
VVSKLPTAPPKSNRGAFIGPMEISQSLISISRSSKASQTDVRRGIKITANTNRQPKERKSSSSSMSELNDFDK